MKFILTATILLFFLIAQPITPHAFELPPAESFHNGLGMQGYTGVFNIPNAHVTDEGWFYALYSNQKESKWRDRVPFEDNYLFSAGFFNFIEVGGRLFEATECWPRSFRQYQDYQRSINPQLSVLTGHRARSAGSGWGRHLPSDKIHCCIRRYLAFAFIRRLW